MSASTISITANPAARRRPVLSTERKTTTTTSLDLVGLEADSNGAPHARDLSHSIMGEEPLPIDRSRDPILLKKTTSALDSPSLSPPPRRTRKGTNKPRWLRVVSVVGKNFVLLAVVLGLVQFLRKAVLNSGQSTKLVGTVPGISEIEAKFAEMDSLFKTATKIMQQQVDVVDNKIENQILGLREELSKKIEESGTVLATKLNSIASRTENLDKVLGELAAKELLTSEDLVKFYQQQEEEKDAVAKSNSELNLDDVRAYARQVILEEIEKHAADGLGRVDYALATGGASVVKHSEAFVAGKGNNWLPVNVGRTGVHHDARKMLTPSFGEPGQCFPLRGSRGFVQIRLRTAIFPEAVTLEHVAKSIAYDRSSAPKDCNVSGWYEGSGADPLLDTDKPLSLVEFTYDLEKSNIQTFDVSDIVKDAIINTIRLDFTSNHGSNSHTCIYRLRVHGH